MTTNCKEKRFEIKRITVFIYSIFLISNIHSQCGTSVNAPTTINGINVTGAGTGFSIFTSPFSACGGTISLPSNSLHLGLSGAFSYTYTFSSPVNNLTLVTVGTGHVGTPAANENFIFTTNGGGTPTLNLGTNCFTSVTGNQILSGAFSGGSGGGFEVTVFNSSGPFTTLTISGNGGLFGSLMALCSNSPVFLGVEYENKEVVVEENYNLIRWTTSHERNSSHFDVLKSVDGIHFTKIGTRIGMENSNTLVDYNLNDENVSFDKVYYKILQYDLDGASSESELMIADRKGMNDISIFPNPASDYFYINNRLNQYSELKIYSSEAKLVKHISLELVENKTPIDISDLPMGVYLIELTNEEESPINNEMRIKFFKI